MNSRMLCALAAAVLVGGCGGGGGDGGGGGGQLSASASVATLTANGTSTTAITVSGGMAFPVVVQTPKGTFDNGRSSISFATGPVVATLRTCDSRVVPSCAGTVLVNVADASGASAMVAVTFLVAACNGNGGAVEVAGEASCGDGFDNDCDGLADCDDASCGGKVCNSAPSTSGGFTTGVCGATSKVCACTATLETGARCGNGLDDDCDGLIDCEDPSCQDAGAGGQACDTQGRTCSAAVAGLSSCSVCTGNGGAAETVEANCADGKDNDCDGTADCADPSCAVTAGVCSATGRTCTAAGACSCPSGQLTEQASQCGDGNDNDCDGLIDCADPDCRTQACNPFGSICSAGTPSLCTCTGNGGAAQASETSCNDGRDNDCDGPMDCADPGCQPAGVGQLGAQCDASPTKGLKCDVSGTCACGGNGGVAEGAEQACADGFDNDCDGLADCADPTCAARACSAFGMSCGAAACSVCSGNGGLAQVAETLCSDAADNDCDGRVDCADTQCGNQACNTAVATDGITLTSGRCNATSFACVCTQAAEGTGAAGTCGDGVDNDCDGKADCADAGCQPVGNALGGACDALGNRCSPLVATVSTCTVCAPGGDANTAEAVETRCGDGLDNNCDGKADCQDANCASQALACDATGKACTSGLLCRCPDTSGVENLCSDGGDNDCDGFIDCKDLSCNARDCAPDGFRCSTTANGAGTCVCSGNGGTAQASETSCADRFDNDCDGQVDCADPGCRPATSGTFGSACATTALVANARCDFFGQCTCPGGQTRETSCGDSTDNDCDGLADCADPDCGGQTCGSSGRVCQGGACSCPGGAVETCDDTLDNNCDGKADCDDTACGNQACNTSAPTFKCLQLSGAGAYFCKDTSNFIITLTAGATKVAADGKATTTLTAFLQDGQTAPPVPFAPATIGFAVVGGGSLSSSSLAVDNTGPTKGKATVTFTAPATSGTATVTATYVGPTTITASAAIGLPLLSQINLAAQQFAVMGARASGFQESNQLTFQLIDSSNQPYPAGLDVTFEHQPLGGSYIGAAPSCVTVPTPLCTATGQTDASGKVTVLLHSGSIAGVVSVTARAQAGGSGPRTFTAPNIAIVGAKASGAQITLTCGPRNIPAFTDTDCTNSNYAGSDALTTCRVTLADRFGNALGVPTVASYLTEAGIAGPPATTPAYDTSKPPGQQTTLGTGSSFVRVTGGKLPVDVAPFTDPLAPADWSRSEYSLSHNWDSCGTRTHNPRDGLVTVIVEVRGEEGFVDGSPAGCPRDGVYTPTGTPGCLTGEYYIDIGDPFVDVNDNGQWDAGEPFDPVANGVSFVGPNGAWDADTTIWAETRIVYTDYLDGAVDASFFELGSRFHGMAPPAPTAPASVFVFATKTGPPAVPASSDTALLYVTDKNFNLPNSRYSYTASKSAGTFTVAFPTGGQPTTLDALGMTFRQLYCSTRTPSDVTAQCSSACTSTPCYPVTDVSNFSYGAYGALTFTGGSSPDGAICGFVTGSLQTQTASGGTQTVNTTVSVCGTSAARP